jgi:2,4-dienoyl-CoA reductase-like NADH-dependent reductase (Old Yellow Enzyme family)
MRYPTLFQPMSLGLMSLPHRMVMAPMTRARTDQPENIPDGHLLRATGLCGIERL